MNLLHKHIFDISYKYGLSHIGSCITAIDIIDEIYSRKKSDDKFVLSCGHAHLAHLVVMEKYNQLPLSNDMPDRVELLIVRYGIHCDRRAGCDVSTGSLGNGIGIAVGMALADRTKNVWCLLSDGEMNEGSCYEALEVIDKNKLSNLKLYINCNGWGAYMPIDTHHLVDRCSAYRNVFITFRSTNVDNYPFLEGQAGHYYKLSKDDYEKIIC